MEDKDESKELEVGMYLCTKQGQDWSNAIIIEMGSPIKILTDFGNIRKFTSMHDVLDIYEISQNWLEAKKAGFPLPTLSERIQEQINLLQAVLIVVKE